MKAYLDNGATTRVDPRVVKVMKPFFTKHYGNPSSLHSWGRTAREAVEKARKTIADKIGAKPQEIIFTSGGTESDNLAIKGVALKKGKGHIITSKIEHHAVLNTCKSLEKKGFKVTYLPVDTEGFVKTNHLKRALRDNTILVSIMHANNEIGTIQPIKEFYKICRKNKVLFHTDAVQSFTKTSLKAASADLISLSSHKIHGPKGVGALYVKDNVRLEPVLHGGGHESGLRAGTENAPGVIGFAKAVELCREPHIKEMTKLRDYLIKEVKKIDGSRINGPLKKRLCNNLNASFEGVEGESLLLQLDAEGIAVSTGSACSSKELEPSHVLTAIGLRPEQSHGTIRATISRFTTKEEIDYFLKNLREIIKKLRSMNPL
ncbi:aminotransferase class V-fold PLP-dependent enzyme [archaeon]|nr:aminotransferase class V-fold PLP-dependent enzyme [archaeon]